MWSICRAADLYEIQWDCYKRNLDITRALHSGFVGPDDDLVIMSPSGIVEEVTICPDCHGGNPDIPPHNCTLYN